MAEGQECAESVALVAGRFVCRVADMAAAAVDSQLLAVEATGETTADETTADESAERVAVAVHQEAAGSQAQVFDFVVVPSRLGIQLLEVSPGFRLLRPEYGWV